MNRTATLTASVIVLITTLCWLAALVSSGVVSRLVAMAR